MSTGSQLSSQELQGLFLSNQHIYAQPSPTGQNLQIVKREPEDLSHHRKLDSSSPSSASLDSSIIVTKQPRHKVTSVVSYRFLCFHATLNHTEYFKKYTRFTHIFLKYFVWFIWTEPVF